ncbi:hypothetical protein [Mucilaginibacter sp. dw_454]|uniref:hypothetical protein n=1 Tax=Mucilaginibacter sp. dw_454 TaxID=2720079 RepID=UPI001BD2EC70|nr:hypothetical protein [Mucilaginibacter sp. dw_454]
MSKISLPKYEELKKLLLVNAGIANILPSECRALSDRVYKKNGNRISETTFKRIYGFAYSKYNPSLFTLNVLARFCNFKGWDDFCEKQDQKASAATTKELSWRLIQQNASKITNFTLQALKNKSGIPYNQTIDREFIDHHFEEFINSEHTGTVLTAPAGYGKTIALCQWVEKKFEVDALNDVNDIILLFSSNAIMSALMSGRDIHDWMLALLGYHVENDINVLMDVKQRGKSKFYLIIDGFDEHMFKGDHFRVIMNQLVDIFSFYQSHDWFKLVLTARTATWINNRHEFDIGTGGWYTGFKKDDNCINVPLFSVQEIKLLCHQIKPGIEDFISLNVVENFNHPLYFQFYYQQHKDNFLQNNIDHLSFYETISTFILKKVYLGQYSAEKMLLIKGLVEELDIRNEHYQINKLKVANILKKYPHAYQELLSVGFVREVNTSSIHQFNTDILFGNNEFMEHSIAKTLLYDNSNLLDADLIKTINELFTLSPRKVNVLKWCLIHAIKTGQLKSVENIIDVHLNTNEKSEIITFLGEVLESEHSSSGRNDALTQYFKHSFSEKLFDYFFGLELVSSDYKKFLQVLLRFELSNKNKILIHSALAIIAAMQLDLNELEVNLAKLKAFPKADFETFPVNPLTCLDAIFYHLKYGIIKTEALTDLTKLSFSSPGEIVNFKCTATNDMLFLLGLHTLALSNNPLKQLRFIKFLNHNYCAEMSDNHSSQYRFFIKTIEASSYFVMGELEKVSEIYEDISINYKKCHTLATSYMRMVFHSLKIKTLVNAGKEIQIATEIKQVNNIAAQFGYKFAKLYILSILLKSPMLQNSAPELYRQINYDFNKLTRDSGLNLKLFLETITIRK